MWLTNLLKNNLVRIGLAIVTGAGAGVGTGFGVHGVDAADMITLMGILGGVGGFIFERAVTRCVTGDWCPAEVGHYDASEELEGDEEEHLIAVRKHTKKDPDNNGVAEDALAEHSQPVTSASYGATDHASSSIAAVLPQAQQPKTAPTYTNGP